jgi:hypothetical protein
VPVLDVVAVRLGVAVLTQPGADGVAVGTEDGGSGVLAPGRLGLAVRPDVEEPQRGAGQRQPAQGGVLDIDEQALRESFVSRGAHEHHRDACSSESLAQT